MFEKSEMPSPKPVESTEGLDRSVVPEFIAQHMSTIETRKEQIAKIDDEIKRLEEQLKERKNMREFFEKDINGSQGVLEAHQHSTELSKRFPEQDSESALKKLN